MLKTRLVAVLIVRQGIVVQSFDFNRYLPVGSPAIAVEYLDRWGVDEIVVLDIDATPDGRQPAFDRIGVYSSCCHVPLTIGGGITEVDDIVTMLQTGADKVVINSAAVDNPRLISDGARLFGSQCIVVSVDARRTTGGEYATVTQSNNVTTGYTPVDLAKRAEDHGAGEIFLNAVHRDGARTGYDLALIETVIAAVAIPVIVCGGVGHSEHFRPAIDLGASAVAAANFFHHTEHSVTVCKSFLTATGADMRLDSYVTYDAIEFDSLGRVHKREDDALEQLFVEFTPEEVI
jgi:cyclase